MEILFNEMKELVSPDAIITIQDLTGHLHQVDAAIRANDSSSALTGIEGGMGDVDKLIQVLPDGTLRDAWIDIRNENAAAIQNMKSNDVGLSEVVSFFESVNNHLNSAMNGVTVGSDQSYGEYHSLMVSIEKFSGYFLTDYD